MSKTSARFSIILLVFWVTGGQWLMMQSVAWVNMFRDFSRTDTLSQALTKTFDGNHSCSMCRFIQKEKGAGENQANQSKRAVPKVEKAELFLVTFADLPITFLAMGKAVFSQVLFSDWQQAPLSPPPKKA